MISAELPSVNPMPAAAQPEYEFSIEITTGMSAPPIGMISSAPSTSAMTRLSSTESTFCPSFAMSRRPLRYR